MAEEVSRRDTSAPEREASSFGELLRRLRKTAGLTQEELATRAGLTAKAVGSLERGERKRPYPHTLRSLADALGLEEDERGSLLAAVQRRRDDAPAAAPVDDSRSNLPTPLAPLVGREKELEEIQDFLNRPEVRLLTLTGTGGVGKTRLALETAREAKDLFEDGVAFVALASLNDAGLVAPTIARALGLREAEGRTLREVLCDHLREKHLLLVLDNFEQVLEAAPEVAALIKPGQRLTVLVTSRAPLRVRGEQEYPVPPLTLPASTLSSEVEEVEVSASGRLFTQRARAASPAFELTAENVSAVAAICWRLAGLPLALELAAARTRFLDPRTLLGRLDRALSSGWARDVPERQRTMRSTLDWSHELLSEGEKVLFRRLSVFSGGWTLAAAEEVGGSGALDPEEVLDLLGRLVEQSLVTVERNPGARYGMLEPVRQYAWELLEANGEAEASRRRHTAFFLALAEEASPQLGGPRQVEWLGKLDQERDNLRAAIGWALSAREAASAARLGWALWLFWWLHGYENEGRRWMEATLEQDLPPALRARASNVAASTSFAQGDFEACERHSRESLRASLEAGDVALQGYSWVGLGLVALGSGVPEEAASCFQRAISFLDRSGEGAMAAMARAWLGMVFLVGGDHERAVRSFDEGLALARQTGDRFSAYIALYNLAQVALGREDYVSAEVLLDEGVALSGEMGDRANLAYFLEGLAVAAGARDEAARSARLFGASEGLLEAAGRPTYNHYVPDRALYESIQAGVRSLLGEVAFEEAWAEGREMDLQKAVEYALEGEGAPDPPPSPEH